MATHDELDWNVSPSPRKNTGDINAPTYGPQRKKESRNKNANSTGVESTTGIEPEKTPDPEIRFVSAQFEPHPMNGYEPNKECIVTGKAEFLTKTSRTKCTLELFATYSDREENLCLPEEKYGTAFIEQDGTFKFKAVPLYIPAGYPFANGFTDKIGYRGCISAQRHEQPWDFFLDLPDETVEKPPILKRGMHDDTAVERYPSKYSASGDGYLKGNPIFEFQKTLEDYKYLSMGTANGVFGPKTESATKEFQRDSQGKARVNRKNGKLVEAPSVTYKDQVDGIVGPNTRDEVAVWKRENFLRPLPTLYHGDYDREGVYHGKGKRGTDEYHEKGDPVIEAQKKLKQVGAYDGEEDGWFFDKMQDAVNVFQEYAEKGQFLVDGVLTDIGEKLTGFVKGELGPETQEFVKKVEAKKGKVPRSNAKCLKKGDKGKAVEEINIRLSGFGGGVPSDTFDALTETKVKNFQRDYMKMAEPTGVVDMETAKAIDSFGDAFALTTDDMAQLKCKCGSCDGFGKGRHKGEYRDNKIFEAYNQYEYPGVHRMLLWGVSALQYHLKESSEVGAKMFRFSSGYRCHDHDQTKKSGTTNHMGKAVDILFSTMKAGKWTRPDSADERNKTVEAVREFCTKQDVLNAQYKWPNTDRFSMETTAQGATTWVHIDVRVFSSRYLSERFFASKHSAYKGKPLTLLMKG